MRLRRLTPDLLRRNREFRRFWTGQTISLLGDEISFLAIPLLAVLTLNATAAQMGLLTAVGLAPNLLFSLHAGSWADGRASRRRLMLAADIGRAALLATIPLAYALGVLTFAQLYVVGFGVGSLSVLFFVSYNTLFVALVDRDDYVSASSLLNGSRAISLVVGEGAAGVLVAALTAPFALVADALSFVGSAIFFGRIRAPEPPPAPAGHGRTRAGLRFIARTPVVRAALGASATVNLFNFAYWAIFVLFAARELGVGPLALGFVLAFGALGAILGALITSGLTSALGIGRALVIGFVLFPAPLLLVPLASGSMPFVLALLGLAEFASSVGLMILDISLGALLAAVVPDEVRARVSGAYMLVNFGVRPLGALLGGALGAAIGLRSTLWIAAAGALAGVLWLLPSPVPRLRGLPDPAPAQV